MSKKEKPLPKPPGTPCGRKRRFEPEHQNDILMADQMAAAMAEGKLDEFIQKELPDNEHARKLAEMMMGMSGMMPLHSFSGIHASKHKEASPKQGLSETDASPPASSPSEEVVNAAKRADVEGLMDLLKNEHEKRQGKKIKDSKDSKSKPAPPRDQAVIEKKIIEELITIASDNNLSLDWVFFRALKRYVSGYKKTGSL